MRSFTAPAVILLLSAAAMGQRRAPAAAPIETPSRYDVVRAEVAMVAAMRACLRDDGWTVRTELAFNRQTGRVTATPPDGVTWSPAERRCVVQAAGRVRGPRFSQPEFHASATLEGRDPRSLLLSTVNVAACLPNFNACNCHLNVGVSMNGRRPTVVAGVVFDVQGCVPEPLQLECLESAVRRMSFPANARDTGGFRGPVGPACGS